MKASTLPRYLIGSKQAILDIAASPLSIVIGLLFVISAGLAREYDGEDLLHGPWHALRPLAVSLASGTTLFLLVHGTAMLRRGKDAGAAPPLGKAYRSFMALFWMTAPLAWLYAIPYERFMSPVDAIGVNLWTLAIVAAWRVLLMSHVISVVYGVPRGAAFFLVMLFADVVAYTAIMLTPTPVIEIMGGIRHTERDALVLGVTSMVTFLSVLSAPIWILGGLISAGLFRPKWATLTNNDSSQASRGMLVTAVVSIFAFTPLLFMGQPEQMNRRVAERLLREGRIAEAFSFASERHTSDFPPHWNPPPRLGYRERVPELRAVRNVIREQLPPQWLMNLYLDKIGRALQEDLLRHWPESSWEQIVERLEERPDISEVDSESRATASFLIEFDATLSESDRIALDKITRMREGEDSSSPSDTSGPTTGAEDAN